MTSSKQPFAAVLLAGGQSRRMRRDKALLDWEGQPLWQHQLATLRELNPARLLLSCRREQNLDASGAEVLFDPPDNPGPLPALARCLHVAHLPLLALAVDMPHMTADFLQSLVTESLNSGTGLVFYGPHGYEPLCAVYPVALLPLLHDCVVTEELSLQNCLQRAVDARLMRVFPLSPEQEAYFFNLNTPQDLACPPPPPSPSP